MGVMLPGIFQLSTRQNYDQQSRRYYYSILEIEKMDILTHNKQFISDTLSGKDAAFIL